MNKRIKPALIIILVIAVIAASFSVFKIHEKRINGGSESRADTVSESRESGSVNGTDGSPEGGGPQDGSTADSEDKEPLATVFFASDYQAEDGFDEPSVTLSGILNAAKEDGKSIDEVVMCGDYSNDRKLHDYQISPDDTIEEIRETVNSVYPDIDDEDMMIVQGNHDRMTPQITETGLHEEDGYLVYILNTEEDFPWKQGKTSGCLAKVRKSSAEMKECFDELIRKGEKRPVIIAGHVPLQFTARTSSRHTTGDNLYSSLIFDVVNDAAKSLDIVYLFGHDHSKGWDCYIGGSSVYRAKGDSLLVPKFRETDVNTDDYDERTLNFTYLNAGYTGYYMNCGPEELDAGEKELYSAADETLTGTVFEIYRDRIVITRYDTEGVHELGHAGEADPYKGGIDTGLIPEESYSKSTESPQEVTF